MKILIANLDSETLSFFDGEPTEEIISGAERGDLEITRFNVETDSYEFFDSVAKEWTAITSEFVATEADNGDENQSED